jgi:subtilisin family serine protease
VAARRMAVVRAVSLVVALLLLWPTWATPAAHASGPPEKPTAPPVNHPAVPDELIVGFKPGTEASAQDVTVAARGGQTQSANERFAFRVVKVGPGKRASDEIAEYIKDPAVRYVEPNYLYRTVSDPNDPRYADGSLWGLRNTGQSVGGQAGVADADIDAELAWATTTGSQGVVVGVVDSGIDYTHPDLAANIWSAPAGWNLRGCGPGTHGFRQAQGLTNCNPLDDDGHGTHVAGTIGARGDNATGGVGVNWQVQLMGLKFLDSNGSGTTADAVAVLQYALDARLAGLNLRVLNNSWGGGGYSQALYDAIDALGDAGVLFVAAAGNNGANNDNVANYPSNYDLPNIVAVAATDNRDLLAGFSNFGEEQVDLGAPGVNITSTLPGNTYGSYSGTSMASPHVAGVAALLLAQQGSLTTIQLKNRLVFCGDLVPALENTTFSGRRLNAAASLAGCPTDVTVTLQAVPGGTASISPLQATYEFGTEITLTATADAGFTFVSWLINNAHQGSANPLTIAVRSNLLVVPIFARANPFEDFDGVAVSNLPPGWTTSRTGNTCNFGDSGPWRTVTSEADSAPNAAFAGDPSCVSDNILVSPAFVVPTNSSRLRFRHLHDLESTYDGAVLEIAIAGGAFNDIVSAGGSFGLNGYDGPLSACCSNPLAGRAAWTGLSGGWITTVVNLPPAAAGQSVQLRWRVATDASIHRAGWWIDTITTDPGSPTLLYVAPATGPFGGTASLSATLTADSDGVAGKTILFTIGGLPACGMPGKPACPTTDDDGVATLPAASLAGKGVGTYAGGVTASFAGDALHDASASSATLTVTKAAQTITFAPLPDRPGSDSQFVVAATASSGLPVSFAASPPAVCTVGGASGTLVTLAGAGTCTITASQVGNATYNAATPVPHSFLVTSAPPVRQALTVTVSGTGTVLVAPPGVSSTGDTYLINTDTAATLTPQPGNGQTFIGWVVDGADKGWASPLDLTMGGAHTVQAIFVATADFGDVTGGAAFVAITELASRGAIFGYTNGNYGPNDPVQRAQMAALIARATPAGPHTPPTTLVPPACLVAGSWDCENWGNSFTDPGGIDANLWRNAGALQHYGVALGYTAQDCASKGKTFPCYGPTDPVSHAQTIAFITRAMIAKGYWLAQPNAQLPYAGVPAVLATEVKTYHYYTGGIPAAPTTANAWNGVAQRGWFALALWTALDSYWGTDALLPDGRPAGGRMP